MAALRIVGSWRHDSATRQALLAGEKARFRMVADGTISALQGYNKFGIINDQIEKECRPIPVIILNHDRSDNHSITNIRYLNPKT